MNTRRDLLKSVAVLPLIAAGLDVGINSAMGAPPSKLMMARMNADANASPGLLIGGTIDGGMFKNLASSFISLQSRPGYAFPAILDENGYPTSTPTYNIGGELPLPNSIAASDSLVIKFTGTGAIQLGRGAPGFTVISGANFVSGSSSFNLTVSGTNPRVVFKFNASVPTAVSFNFPQGSMFSGMGNLTVCRLADEAALQAGTTPDAMFSDDYIDAFKSLKAKVVRPMGMTNPNFGNVSQSRYIANWSSSLNISSERWAPGAWAGVTSGTDNYICSKQKDGSQTYVDGEMIQLQFANANTSSMVTLNSGGRGTVPIAGYAGQPLQAGQIAAGSLCTLTYDALLAKFLWQSGGQTPCIPFELQVGFANRIGSGYWCNFPTYFDDASVRAIATVVRDRLSPTVNAYFEYSNEIWNFGFQGTGWAAAKGAALGFPDGDNRRMHGWYGLRFKQMMDITTAVWSPRSLGQLKRTIAFQAFGPAAGTAAFRFEGSDLNGSTFPLYAAAGYRNFDTAPNRPIDCCEVLSYATYYSGAQCTNFDANYMDRTAAGITGLLKAADFYNSGVPLNMNSALLFIDNDVRSGSLSTGVKTWETLDGLKSVYGAGIYAPWQALAVKYGKTIECYEGGFECNFPSVAVCNQLGIDTAYGGPSGKIAVLLNSYKNSSLFASLVKDQLAEFFSYSCSKTAAWLLLNGPSQWSISTGTVFDPYFQSWNGLTSFAYKK